MPSEIKLTLQDAIRRGLEFNLGLMESEQADAAVQAERARAFSALLPQISARAEQSLQQVSLSSIGIRVPTQAGLPPPLQRSRSGMVGNLAVFADYEGAILLIFPSL